MQSPRIFIPSKPATIRVSFPLNVSQSHCHVNISLPLNLPVTASRQWVFTQQLPAVKSFWVLRIQLLFLHQCHHFVVFWHFEEPVCCVYIQCELTEIWWRDQNRVYDTPHDKVSILSALCLYKITSVNIFYRSNQYLQVKELLLITHTVSRCLLGWHMNVMWKGVKGCWIITLDFVFNLG